VRHTPQNLSLRRAKEIDLHVYSAGPAKLRRFLVPGSRFTPKNEKQQSEATPMARKPNYDHERRERERLKAIKTQEKAAAKQEARERARAKADTTTPDEDNPRDGS
jgi:hypothetical protein